MTDLEKNKEFVDANWEKLFSKYPNKYVVVFNQQVDSFFDTYASAANYGFDKFGTDEKFLVEYITNINEVNFVMSAIL